MSITYLSTLRFIKAKILTWCENILHIKKYSVESVHGGYKLASHPKAINFRPGSEVGVYIDSKRKKYFIKDYAYTFKNLDYEYLHNEINTLKIFKGVSVPGLKVRMAEIVRSIDSAGSITLITKIAEGQTLDHFSNKLIRSILIDVLTYLDSVSNILPQTDLNTIPKRQHILTFLTFPFYLFRAVIKDRPQFTLLFKSKVIFLKMAPRIMFDSLPYGINHRDLSVDNILYDKKSKYITILDTECTVRGDRLYDMALLPRLFVRYLKSNEFLSIFESWKLSKSEMNRLILLMIVGCVIKIATEEKDNRDYKNAQLGLKLIINSLIPKITKMYE